MCNVYLCIMTYSVHKFDIACTPSVYLKLNIVPIIKLNIVCIVCDQDSP